jgi:hypothetical protein
VAKVYEQKGFWRVIWIQRFFLGKVPDLSEKWNELKNWFGSRSAYFEERNRCVAIGS